MKLTFDDFYENMDELACIIESLPRKAISLGPLPEKDLLKIQSRIHDPPLKLVSNETKIEPPVKESGFPSPMERQQKLFSLLETLETQNIIRQYLIATSISRSSRTL